MCTVGSLKKELRLAHKSKKARKSNNVAEGATSDGKSADISGLTSAVTSAETSAQDSSGASATPDSKKRRLTDASDKDHASRTEESKKRQKSARNLPWRSNGRPI
jgi:hypothetical protein